MSATTREYWLTTREIVVAFMVGYIEATMWRTDAKLGETVPRFLEDVCQQLDRVLQSALGGAVNEVSMEEVEYWLLHFSQQHTVVQHWRIDHDDAVRRAIAYLQVRAELNERAGA